MGGDEIMNMILVVIVLCFLALLVSSAIALVVMGFMDLYEIIKDIKERME